MDKGLVIQLAKKKGKRSYSRKKKQISLVRDGGVIAGLSIGGIEAYQQSGGKPTLAGIGIQSVYRLTGYDIPNNKLDLGAAKGGMLVIGAPLVAKVGRRFFGPISIPILNMKVF